MKKVVVYFPTETNLTKALPDMLAKILTSRYGVELTTFSKVQISDVLEIIPNDIDLFISIEESPNVLNRCISRLGAIFIYVANTKSNDFAKKYNNYSISETMDIQQSSTLYTRNEKVSTPVYIVYGRNMIDSEILPIAMTLSDAIIDFFGIKKKNMFNREAKQEINYSIILADKSELITEKDLDTAKKICDNYNAAVLKDSNGVIVYYSAFGKTDPSNQIKKSNNTIKRDYGKKAPVHKVKRTTNINKF